MTNLDGHDLSLKAGTTTIATGTGQFLGVYLSSDNTVSPINTTTNLSKYLGVTQGYANKVNGAIRVRVNGATKVTMQGTGTATVAGDYLTLLGANTTTAHGKFTRQARTQADATAGSVFLAGMVLATSGPTNTISEMVMHPSFSSALTTTVGS